VGRGGDAVGGREAGLGRRAVGGGAGRQVDHQHTRIGRRPAVLLVQRDVGVVAGRVDGRPALEAVGDMGRHEDTGDGDGDPGQGHQRTVPQEQRGERSTNIHLQEQAGPPGTDQRLSSKLGTGTFRSLNPSRPHRDPGEALRGGPTAARETFRSP